MLSLLLNMKQYQNFQYRTGLICLYRGLPGVVDGGCLPLVIGGSGVDQGGVGGLRTPPSGRAWSDDHFYVYYVHIRGFL